jgi:hypothetical protein
MRFPKGDPDGYIPVRCMSLVLSNIGIDLVLQEMRRPVKC